MHAVRPLALVLTLLTACSAVSAWAAVNPLQSEPAVLPDLIPASSAPPPWREQLAGLTPEQRQQMREQIRDQWQNRPQEERQRMREEFREQREFRREERQQLRDSVRDQPGGGNGGGSGGGNGGGFFRRGGGRF